MLDPDAFIQLTLDLTASLGSADRYGRLLDTVRRVLPCDAAALLRLDPNGALVAVATHGLNHEVKGRKFQLTEHPRLEAICRSESVVSFPENSELPDPFDGLLDTDRSAVLDVHACLGCALRVEGELVGALTADALDPKAFRQIDLDSVRALAALAGATLRTTELIAALELRALSENVPAKSILGRVRKTHEPLVGQSEAYQQLKREIELVGPSDLAVLVMGETGVGKELVVRALHEASRRRNAPLVQVNCAALPESLVESELFGHVRGAFTGAQTERQGKLQKAHGGTLFLDEIGELPLSIQPKLLRAIQQGEVQRVGSDAVSRVDIRILAATNRDLAEEVRLGRFRPDLYHRLAVYPLRVPSLRERSDDIAPLVGHFVDQARSQLGAGDVRVTQALLQRLERYEFPGNVRELENIVSRAVLRAASRTAKDAPVIVGVDDLGADVAPPVPHSESAKLLEISSQPSALAQGSLRDAVDQFQRMLIRNTVAECGGNWSLAAQRLRMNRANLHHLAVRLGLK